MFVLGKRLRYKGKDIKLSALEFMILVKIFQTGSVGISGYTLMDDLTRFLAGTWSARSGTVYPLLNRLIDKGFLTAKMVKSEVGPAKKIYLVTDFSKELIEGVVSENFEPELKFFENYMQFLVDVMIQISSETEESDINLEQVKQAVELFSTHVDGINKNLAGAIDLSIRKCPSCGAELDDREGQFCFACGVKLGE